MDTLQKPRFLLAGWSQYSPRVGRGDNSGRHFYETPTTTWTNSDVPLRYRDTAQNSSMSLTHQDWTREATRPRELHQMMEGIHALAPMEAYGASELPLAPEEPTGWMQMEHVQPTWLSSPATGRTPHLGRTGVPRSPSHRCEQSRSGIVAVSYQGPRAKATLTSTKSPTSPPVKGAPCARYDIVNRFRLPALSSPANATARPDTVPSRGI